MDHPKVDVHLRQIQNSVKPCTQDFRLLVVEKIDEKQRNLRFDKELGTIGGDKEGFLRCIGDLNSD